MWMMGYSSSDGGDLNPNFQDSSLINSRRLGRPRSVAAASTNPPCSLFHGNDLFALNHHFAAVGEQNKRELNTQQVVVSSSRWNPTPEQVQALEELYRRGTRTPSAEEIQQITAQLRRYGKIEGKNVFYWFQNHKARERQKRRRQQLSPSSADDQQQINNNNNTSNLNKDNSFDLLEGANRTRDEVEQTKYWVSPTCSSTIPPEKSVCSTRQGSSSSKAIENTTTAAESKADGWLLFDHNITTLTTTDQVSPHHHLQHDQHTPTHLPKPNYFNMLLLQPYSTKNRNREDSQTLQLFPVLTDVRGGGDHDDSEAEAILMGSADHIGPTHDHDYQFFEFLPIKN